LETGDRLVVDFVRDDLWAHPAPPTETGGLVGRMGTMRSCSRRLGNALPEPQVKQCLPNCWQHYGEHGIGMLKVWCASPTATRLDLATGTGGGQKSSGLPNGRPCCGR